MFYSVVFTTFKGCLRLEVDAQLKSRLSVRTKFNHSHFELKHKGLWRDGRPMLDLCLQNAFTLMYKHRATLNNLALSPDLLQGFSLLSGKLIKKHGNMLLS